VKFVKIHRISSAGVRTAVTTLTLCLARVGNIDFRGRGRSSASTSRRDC